MDGRRCGAGGRHPRAGPPEPAGTQPGSLRIPRGAGRSRTRHAATRQPAPRPARTRAAASQAGSRSRRARQGRVPRHDEPRNPHPAQRHHPDAGDDRQRPAGAGPARDAADRQSLLAATAAHRRRHPRLLPARSQPARTGNHQLQPARTAGQRDPADGPAGTAQAPEAGAAHRPGRAPAGARRPAAAAPGDRQSGRQRDQVHRTGRRGRQRLPSGRNRQSAQAALRGHRHRHRPVGRAAIQAVQLLHPGRCLDHAAVWRYRAWAGHQQAHRGVDGRPDRRRVGTGPRLAFLVRNPAVEDRRRPAPRQRRRPAARTAGIPRRHPAPARDHADHQPRSGGDRRGHHAGSTRQAACQREPGPSGLRGRGRGHGQPPPERTRTASQRDAHARRRDAAADLDARRKRDCRRTARPRQLHSPAAAGCSAARGPGGVDSRRAHGIQRAAGTRHHDAGASRFGRRHTGNAGRAAAADRRKPPAVAGRGQPGQPAGRAENARFARPRMRHRGKWAHRPGTALPSVLRAGVDGLPDAGDRRLRSHAQLARAGNRTRRRAAADHRDDGQRHDRRQAALSRCRHG